MRSKFFTGEHSTVLINLDEVVYAIADSPSGGARVVVFFKKGGSLVLRNGNADMFRAAWQEAGQPVPTKFSDDESAAYSSQP